MNNKMYSTKTKLILQHNQFSNNIVIKKKTKHKNYEKSFAHKKKNYYHTIANKANITFSFNI